MPARPNLLNTPPYEIEQVIKILGANLRTARLRRGLSLEDVAEKAGVGRHAVACAERGKPTTSIAVYTALLWVLGLTPQLAEVANPDHDDEGKTLARAREGVRARQPKGLSDDF